MHKNSGVPATRLEDWRILESAREGNESLSLRRLEWATSVFSALGAQAPRGGPLENARRLISRIREGTRPLDYNDERTMRRLLEADGAAAQFFTIALAANRHRHATTPFTQRRLAQMMNGADTPDEANTVGRDTQFELYAAALLAECGLIVHDGEPDFRVDFGNETLGVAAKRLRTQNRNRLRHTMRKGLRQIVGVERNGLIPVVTRRGILASNLDFYFTDLAHIPSDAELIDLFDARADQAYQYVNALSADPALVAVLIFPEAAAWHRNMPGGRIRLSRRPMFRFIALSDPGAATAVVQEFASGLHGRFENAWTRIQTTRPWL